MAIGGGMILQELLGALLSPTQAGPTDERGQNAGSSRQLRGSPQFGTQNGQVTRIANSKDGTSSDIIVRFETPNLAGALARQQLRSRGLDNGDVGYRGARISGVERDGNNFIVPINGEKRTISGQALMNARGTELASLLGIGSFMELMGANSVQMGGSTEGTTRIPPTDSNPKPTARVGRTANGSAQPPLQQNSNNAIPSAGLPLQTIPTMLASPPQLGSPAFGNSGLPLQGAQAPAPNLIPNTMPQLPMLAQQPQFNLRALLPGFSLMDFSNGTIGGNAASGFMTNEVVTPNGGSF